MHYLSLNFQNNFKCWIGKYHIPSFIDNICLNSERLRKLSEVKFLWNNRTRIHNKTMLIRGKSCSLALQNIISYLVFLTRWNNYIHEYLILFLMPLQEYGLWRCRIPSFVKSWPILYTDCALYLNRLFSRLHVHNWNQFLLNKVLGFLGSVKWIQINNKEEKMSS